MEDNIKIDEDVLNIIKFQIIAEERKNAKTKERNDAKMVDDICEIIQNEVDRIYK